ncbi:sulfatase-like hydrolase/transferase [Vallitalea pronyensis]|uniref:Sulfatase-like hydrolase/transferase n=1 Tax=Vallitalea pronyensis TaxID=1348613 RepID=A0A8J8SGC3_9FIRM|nr:sulfatase-like hydrolase/transferase [Vallitalea pronyensis]QUI22212.1 sulfatase-like hydrolase/transferase [Vallitalea pronyensis]
MMKKNIIVLHTDQQRYDSLGCNGNLYGRTDNIDALAEEGCRFTRHISANTACMPSRASLMTGLYVPGHGVSSNGIPLWRRDNGCEDPNNAISRRLFGVDVRDRIPTMADIFGDHGYDTALFGKIHLQPHLADKSYNFYESCSVWEDEDIIHRDDPFYGFKTRKLILGHGEAPCGYNRGHYGRWLQENHPEYAALVNPGEDANTKEGSIRSDIYLSKIPSKVHHTMWLADEACDYLDKHQDSEKPTFMFVGFPDPHHPFSPPEDIAKDFLDLPLPDFAKLEDMEGDKPQAVMETIQHFNAEKEDIHLAYRYTAASIHLIDKAVGQITRKLKELHMYDDTIIVYTSDHGDFLGDLDMICKYDTAFHNLLHLPFIIKPAKEHKPLPSVVETSMSNADVLPTLLAMSGIEKDSYIQGIDIFDEAAEGNMPMATCYTAREGYRNISIYDDTYRYTYYIETKEEELYNHIADPQELKNLATNPSDSIRKICDDFKNTLFNKHIESDLGIFNHYALW